MKKNNTLDFVKAIACVMVLFIHISFPGNFGYYVSAIARFSVPFFFMVSGYFAYKEKDGEKYIFFQMKKILILFILSFFLYFIFTYFLTIYNNNSIEFISNIFNFKTLKYFLLFNYLPFGGHLWYLSALIYVYLIYYLCKYTFKIEKLLYIFIPILLILCIIIEYLVFSNFIYFKNMVFRNFLFIGLPFFMLGNLISKYKNSYYLKLINNKNIILFLLFGIFYSIYEAYCSDYMDLYFGSIFLSISIFLYGIKNSNIIDKNNIICIIGRKYSLGIYLIHCFFITLYSVFIYDVNNNILLWCIPIIIFIISLIVVYFYYKIKDYLIYKLNNN